MSTMPIELQAARLQLVKSHPYLATLVLAMIPTERPGLGTMAVDQYFRWYYDPEVAKKWSVPELSGVLYHEAQHLLRDHPGRMKTFEAELANIAADLEINDDIAKEKVSLPKGALMPSMYGLKEGLLAEEYYEMLHKNQSSQAQSGQSENGQAGNKQGENSQGENGQSKSGQAGGGQSGNKTPRPGTGNCGSCATGQKAAWEDDAPAKGEAGINNAEAELIRREVATQIIQASKTRGDIPAGLKRWAEEKLSPKVNWKRELAASVRNALAQTAGCVDYTYSRPSRRQMGNVILPSLRQPVPEVAVVVDTSGSISDDMLGQALAEISGILKSAGSHGVPVISVDAAVNEVKRVFDPRQVRLAGGGGTNMNVGIEAAIKLKPRPQVIVVLTDGYTPWPDMPPKAKVIIGLAVDSAGNAPATPAWAKTIKII